MADFTVGKIDGSQSSAGQLKASEWNQIAGLNNLIDASGQTRAEGDLNQLAKTSAIFSSGFCSVIESGSSNPNAYIFNLQPNFIMPTLANGMRFKGLTQYANTGACTINIASTGPKAIKKSNGTTDIDGNNIQDFFEIEYNSINDVYILIKTYSKYDIGSFKIGLEQASHNGWLLWEEGSNLSKTTYASLWTWAQANNLDGAVGTAGKFFVDIDASNFQLQGLSGRVLGSSGSGSGLTSRNFGDKTGAETHTLVASELPSGNTTRIRNVYHVLTGGPSRIYTGTVQDYYGNDTPHNIMQPTTFLNTFIYAGI